MLRHPSNRKHNQRVLDELEPGDIVTFDRGVFRHYAIYTGDEKIIHLAGDEETSGWSHRNSSFSSCGAGSNKAEVKEDSFWNVTKGSKAKKDNENDKIYRPRSKGAIVKEAESRLGERQEYNPFSNNCETFANECRYDRSTSGQGFILGGILVVLTVILGLCCLR